MALSPGTRFGPYEIISPIGAGGMGEVYRAKDTKLHREVALKVLPDSFAADPERLARFTREAQTLASLNHPHIAAIYGLEEAGDVRALVMELVEGEDLSVLIARGPMPLADALPIARQIADALETAHELGIVHRDLKPANIKVRSDGTVKVLDFGLAKATDPASQSRASAANSPTLTAHATQMGVIIGTAAYMAPEQARGKAVDRRADIWAFGVVLYEMLSGSRAFEGDEISDVLASVLKEDVKWDALQADVPAPVRRLLRRCLEKDPKRRLSSIADARLELDEPEPVAVVAPASAGSRTLGATTVAAAAVMGALVTATFFWFSRSPAPVPSGAVTRLSMILPPDVFVPTFRALGSLSPDGRKFVYLAGDFANEQTRVWVRALDQTTARPVPGTERGVQPFWSPDSRTIGFFQDGKVKTIPIEGGTPTTICAAVGGRSGAWAGDNIVFAGDVGGPLMRVSSRGGDPAPVTALDAARGETAHRFAQFLPDGRHFLYVILPAKSGKFDVAIGSLDAQAADRQILMTAESVPTYSAPGYLLYASRNRIVAQPFDAKALKLSGEPVPIGDSTGELNRSLVGGPVVSASKDGLLAYLTDPQVKTKLAWFDLTGKELRTLPSPEGFVELTALSPDDRRASLKQTLDGEVSHWIVDLERGDLTHSVSGTGSYDYFTWSRQGRLAFANDRSGKKDIYAISPDSPSQEQTILKNDGFLKFPSSWSPDGKFLVYFQDNPATVDDIFLVSTDGAGTPQPLAHTAADEYGGTVSPDGRWLAYASNESGSVQVYVQSFPTPGTHYRIGPGDFPAWNRSGTMLSWIDQGRTKLSVADVRPGPEFHASAPRPLAVVPNTPAFTINSDFTRVLATVPAGNSGGPSVTVVSNWLAALEKK